MKYMFIFVILHCCPFWVYAVGSA